MNNIRQKNVIYSARKHNSLPYSYKDTKYNSRQIVNSITINNTFRQLRDNDLFLENQMKMEQNYHVGPKSYNDESLANQANGYKMWSDNYDTIEIYRKQNLPLKDCVERMSTQDVYWIQKYNGLLFFCEATNGLRYLDPDGNVANIQIGTHKFANSKACFVFNSMFFILDGNGLYLLGVNKNPSSDDITIEFTEKKLSENAGIKNGTSIFVDENRILIGNNGKIYEHKGEIDTSLWQVTDNSINFKEIVVRD